MKAVVALNRQRELRPAMAAIGRAVKPAVLRDEAADLRELA